MWKKSLVACILCIVCGFTYAEEASKIGGLKPRQPNWRPEVLGTYANGSPTSLVLYEQISKQEEAPVKQLEFYENGQLRIEADVIQVQEGSPGALEWKTTRVPHGTAVAFFQNGAIEKVAQYKEGLLEGEMKVFYPSSALAIDAHFSKGKNHGRAVAYYEGGEKQEEAFYKEGLLEGEFYKYHPNGTKALLVTYVKGVAHGIAMEWYDTGVLRSELNYVDGVLHTQSAHPAVVIYDNDRHLIEVQDFKEGKPDGWHFHYYASGKPRYKVQYLDGQKEGKEQFFSETGSILGEGSYIKGTPCGKHFREHFNGQIAYLALYGESGGLKEPICEYNEEGKKIAEYFLLDGQPDGDFKRWYPNGQLMVSQHFEKGKFEGEQKEYYPSGLPKVFLEYKDTLKEGVHKEWYENGTLAQSTAWKAGVKEGRSEKWFEDGKLQLKEDYVAGVLDKTRKEWYENGKLKSTGHFALGKKEGTFREWNKEGTLIVEFAYVEDLPHGIMRTWYDNGSLRVVARFVQGKKEGLSEEFYANGAKQGTVFYKEDLLDGELKTWYVNGKEHLIAFYKNGHLVGEQREFFETEDGVDPQLARLFFRDEEGRLHGEQKTFYANGGLQTAVCYDHGQLHGMKALWDQEGNLVEEAFYEKGKLCGRFFQRLDDGKEVISYYDGSRKEGLHEVYYPPHKFFGKVKALEMHFVDDLVEGEVLEYDPSGAVVARFQCLHGLKEGKAELYGEKGKVMARYRFHNDLKEGPAYEYFPSGALYSEVNFVADEKEGEEKIYFENGKIDSLNAYKRGKLHGICRSWNEERVLLFEGEYKQGLRHGVFNKFYADGKPQVIQNFIDDQLHGLKKSYDIKGLLTESKYDKGKKVR